MPSNDFADRLEALEAKVIGLRDLPLAALQRKLESDWQPDPSVLLGDSSITTAMLLDDAVTVGKLASVPQISEVSTSETTVSTTYTNLATIGPSITIAEAGDYIVEVGCYLRTNAGTLAANLMSYDIGGTAAVDADAARGDGSTVGFGFSVMSAHKKTLAAGTVLTAKYRVGNGTGLFGNRWMRATRIA